MFYDENKRVLYRGKKRRGKRHNKKMSVKKRAVIAVSVILAAVLILAAAFFIVFRYRYRGLGGLSASDLGINPDLPPGITNIALFGIDTRDPDSFEGLSDSIMILSIDSSNNKISILSVLRDSLVPIDGHGIQKINSAYSLGGPQLAIKTLNQVFGLDIRNYATVNFSGMSKIIDAVGGVEVEVTEDELVPLSGGGDLNDNITWQAAEEGVTPTYVESAGVQTLNGLQAVAYARIRKAQSSTGENNDWGRTDRQRIVMQQLFNKALNLNKSKYPGLIKALIPYTETSLTYGDIFNLAGIFMKKPSFRQACIMPTEYVIDGNFLDPGFSSVYYNLDFAKNLVYSFIYEDISFEEYVEEHGVDKSGWYYGGGSHGGYVENPDPGYVDPGVTVTSSEAPASSDPSPVSSEESPVSSEEPASSSEESPLSSEEPTSSTE